MASIFDIQTRIGEIERGLEALQSDVPVEHPAYSSLGSALAHLSEAAFELQDGATR